MAPLDLRPQPGAKALLLVELDPVLLGESDRERRPGDETAVDQDRSEELARLLLLGQCHVELSPCDQVLQQEQLPKRPPGLFRSFHVAGYRLELLRPKGGIRAAAQPGAGSAFFTSAMYTAAFGPVARITTTPYCVVWPLGYAALIFDIPALSESRSLNW